MPDIYDNIKGKESKYQLKEVMSKTKRQSKLQTIMK